MATATEHMPRSLSGREPEAGPGARTIPIITTPPTPTPIIKTSAPSPIAGDPMEITTPTNPSAPQSLGRGSDSDSNSNEMNGRGNSASCGEQSSGAPSNNTMSAPSMVPSSTSTSAPAAAAAAIHQPKIVQTAFIHKLYNMLEDPNIQHLISWSSSAESFVMSPSSDFSKVLADVFHTGNPETALWEFKHGNGNFKRGDLVGLREIKRRASRQALVHREYSNQKPTPSQPGTPAEPMPVIHDGSDPRLASMEHSLYDITARLQRSEENSQYMHIKQQLMVDTINKLLYFNQELSRTVLSLVPRENPIHRDVATLQGEIQRQAENFLSVEEPPDPPLSSSRQYFANLDNPPVSPRQLAQDSRPPAHQSRGVNFHRPPVPSNLSIGSRRHYGSTSGAPSQSSPSPLRPQVPPPPPGPHPPMAVEPPPNNLARRHTSADIRAHGWQPNPPPPYLGSGPPSSHWPSSPSRAPVEDHRIREAPSGYSLSRPATPPAPPFSNGNIGSSLESLNNWSWNSANRDNKNLSIRDISTPPTRRGSMAHILNPTDTIERENEDDPRGDDDRKRKRMQ
ncbi:HSF-type DNA-binding-domain-containing protein [Nemania serpens]|nr:HSF-type DNA-binding-domain-containing protein [Nemania serpens]